MEFRGIIISVNRVLSAPVPTGGWEFKVRYLNPITEVSYLSAQNAAQYRKIMRIFYLQYEKMHFQLYKEEVLELLHAEPEYEAYSMEQLKQDLEALTAWKNLTPLQDPKRVYTIADYKNKQYRYTMTEYAAEIERMTVRLENLFLESGNLSTNLFFRLAAALEEAEAVNRKPLKEVNEWWNTLQEDFKRLNQNYQDYLREFYSGKADRLLKTIEFIAYKDRFITYLRDFIQEIQQHSSRISGVLSQCAALIEGELLEKVVKSEMEIPHALTERREDLEESIRDNVWGKWESLKGWFLPSEGRESECGRVLAITNDVIRSIIQNAALIVQLQNWGISRKDDYRKFLELFLNCENMEEAHKLAAHLFGVQHIAHYKQNAERGTDSILSGTYEEEPMAYLLKPHTRTWHPRKDRQGFADRSMEKLLQRTQYLKKVGQERELVLKFIRDGRLEIARIEEVVPETVRTTLLQWISQANLNPSKKGRTEYGQGFYLRKKQGSCVLKCEDGDLTVPCYILEFEDE